MSDQSQQAYAQSVSQTSTNYPHVDTRDPTSLDVNYYIGKFWVNTLSKSVFYLNSMSSIGGFVQAIWIPLQSSLLSLSDNADTVVFPSGPLGVPPNNIQFLDGGGITIVSNPANHTITFSAAPESITWTVITVSQIAADSNGYFCNGASTLDIALPAVANVGMTFEVVAMNSDGFRITQSAGQSIQAGNIATTGGATGFIQSTDIGDWVRLVCNVANNSWFAQLDPGNFIIN